MFLILATGGTSSFTYKNVCSLEMSVTEINQRTICVTLVRIITCTEHVPNKRRVTQLASPILNFLPTQPSVSYQQCPNLKYDLTYDISFLWVTWD